MSVVTLTITERYDGPRLLKEGFRPFFLLAALWAMATLAIWVGALAGRWSVPGVFAPIDWHRHELLYGYSGAVVAGFLLTVVPKWTARAPLSGTALGALVVLWLAGRVAILWPGPLGPLTVAAIDLAFLVALLAWIGRELLLAGNRRNLGVLAVIGLFALGNAVFHREAALGGTAVLGSRLGIATLLLLILVIAGRIVPAFTRNWFIRRESAHRPAAFGALDAVTIAVSALALGSWVLAARLTPPATAFAALLALAATLNLWRLARWHGHRTFADPLVAVLHVAYAFVPAGFAAMVLAVVAPGQVPGAVAVHLWTIGAIALMSLAVMTRAGLGHTGQALVADGVIRAIYLAVVLAAAARVAGGLGLEYRTLLNLGGFAWCGAHALFVLRYARLFTTAR